MKHLLAFESTFFTKSSYIAKGKSVNFPRGSSQSKQLASLYRVQTSGGICSNYFQSWVSASGENLDSQTGPSAHLLVMVPQRSPCLDCPSLRKIRRKRMDANWTKIMNVHSS